MAARIVTVFGGSGFIGRYLVQRLARHGWIVRVAVRRPDRALFLKPMGAVGQITPVAASLRHEGSVAAAVAGADAVVNLVGVLHGRGANSFAAIHVEGAARVAQAARAAGAKTFVQMSALGADPDSPAEYGRSKAAGEREVREVFAAASVARPSIVFGPEDDFFNRFAAMARLSPALPLIGGGRMRFQPIYVGDVADAAAAALENPGFAGQTFELAGPRIYTFKELMELLLAAIGRRRLLLPVPFPVATIQAAILGLLPHPPLTLDQLRLLKTDNVLTGKLPGLTELGIQPTGLEAILPSYLETYRRGGHFARAEAS